MAVIKLGFRKNFILLRSIFRKAIKKFQDIYGKDTFKTIDLEDRLTGRWLKLIEFSFSIFSVTFSVIGSATTVPG